MSDAVATKKDLPLDDVMMAMDVVDTLRHRDIIVERELSEESRESDLIARLREIYEGQGIEVPDHILEQGVSALKEERFVYTPPGGGLQILLARLYVARGTIGKWLGVLIVTGAVLWGGWYFGYERPRIQAELEQRIYLTKTLPAELVAIGNRIAKSTTDQKAIAQAEQLLNTGLRAAKLKNVDVADKSLAQLISLERSINLTYQVRIVSRSGEKSGVWRRAKINKNARNYYLIVEAIGSNGRAIARDIRNEETGKVETVSKWGVRVPKRVYDAVARDKRDDGIIQKVLLGEKSAGKLEPEWYADVSAGAITRW